MSVTSFTPQRSGHNKMNLHLIIALVVTAWTGFAKSDGYMYVEGCSSCPIDGDHDHCDDVYSPPPRIQIDPGMCDKISDLPTEQTKLCKKYEKHPGYYVSCSSQGMTFSCKASCGAKVEDVGKNFTINDKLKDIMSNGLLLGLNTPHEKHEDLLSGAGFGGDLLSFANHPATPEHAHLNPSAVQANNAGHANPFNQNLVPQGAYDVYQPLIIPNQQNQQQPHTNFNFNPLPQPGPSVHNPFPSEPSNFPGTPFFPSNVQHPAPAGQAVPIQRPAPVFPSNVQHPAPAGQAVPVQHPAPVFPSNVQHPAPAGPAVPVQLPAPVFPSNLQHPAPVGQAVPVQRPAPVFPSNVQHPAPAGQAVPVQHPAPVFPSNFQHPAPAGPAVPVQRPAPVFPSNFQHPAPAGPAVPVQLPGSLNVLQPTPTPPQRGPGSPFLPADLNTGYHPAPKTGANAPKPILTPPPRGPGSPFLPTDLNTGYQTAPQASYNVPQPGANVPQPSPTPPPRGPGSPFLPTDLNTGYQPAPQATDNVPQPGANVPQPSPTPLPRGPGSPFLPTDLNTGYQPAPQASDNVPQPGANVPQPSPTPPPRGPGSPFLPTDLNTGYQPAPQATDNVPQPGANVPQPSPTPLPRGPGSPFLPTDLNTGYQPAPQASDNVPQPGANVPQPSPTPPPRGPGSPFLPTDLNTGYQPAPQASDNVPQPTPTQPRSGPGSPFLPTDLHTGYHQAPQANANVPKSTSTTFSPTPSGAGSQFLATDLDAESAIPANPTPQPPKVNPGAVNPALQSDAGPDDAAVLIHPAPAAPAEAVVNDHRVYQPNAQTGFLPTVLANKASISANRPLPGENHADPQSLLPESVHVNPLNTLPTHVISNPASSLPDPKNVLQHTVNNIPANIPKSSLPAVSNPSVISVLPAASSSNSAVPQNSVHQTGLLNGLTNNDQTSYQSRPSLPSNIHGGHTSGLPASGLNTVSDPGSHSNFGPLVSTHVDPSNAGTSYAGFAGFAPFPGHSNFHNNAVAHPAPQVPTLPDLRLPYVPAYNSIHGNAGSQNPPPSAGPKSGGDPFFGFGFGTYGGNNGYQNLGGFNNNNNNYGSTNNHLGQLTDSLHKQMNDLKDTSASGAKTVGTSSSTNTGKTSSSSNINSYNTGSSNAGSTSGGSSTHDLGATNNAGLHANPVSHTMFNQLSNHQGYFQGFQPFNNFMTPPKTENKQQPVSKNNIFSNGLFDFMGRRR